MSALRTAVFAAVCLAQLAVPASLIARHEQTRASGAPYKFRVAPVDPNDPYRGKYVALRYAAELDPVPFADQGFVYMEYNRRVYAELAVGDDGYARLVRVHDERPAGVDYVDVFTRHLAEREDGDFTKASAIHVRLPFDRYYLPEDVAPQVEKDYWDALASASTTTWAEVRVRDGHGALVGLVIDGKPVEP